MKPKPWKTLSSKLVYENPWMRLREDVAEMPNRQTTTYGVVVFGDCVGVVPFVDDDHVLLVRQYRYVQGENHRWEIPTGGVKEGETLEQAAQRELTEEAGYRANLLTHISSYYTSKCICDETAHLYVGKKLTPAEAQPDDTEFLQRRVFPFQRALDMALKGEIMDSMSVLGLVLAARRHESGQTGGPSLPS
ncbi:MAG: NUDIX hydrolase [Deltaproteobacteria bacterium]|nr:MAG: NUDIX hydrolase [Deltaproteobacteria bacterium]